MTLRSYDPVLNIEKIGDLWVLRTNGQTAVCTVTTHPAGWQISVRVDGELVCSDICDTEAAVFNEAEDWHHGLSSNRG